MRATVLAFLTAALLVPAGARASDPDTDDAAQTGQLGPDPDAPRDLVLDEQGESAQACYDRTGARDAGEARVTVEYHVTAAGAVRQARVVEPAAAGAAGRCVLAAVRRHRIPADELARRLGDHPEERLVRHTFALTRPVRGGAMAKRNERAVLRLLGSLGQDDGLVDVLSGGSTGLGGLIGTGGVGTLGGLGVGGGGGLGTLGSGGGGGTGSGFGTGGGRPRATIAIGEPTVRGGLAGEVVRRLLAQRRGAFQACYEMALQRDPTISGALEAHLNVGADGSVSTSGLEARGPASTELRGCVMRQLARVRFPVPEAGGRVLVDVSLTFARP